MGEFNFNNKDNFRAYPKGNRKNTKVERFYISDLSCSKSINKGVRSHWSVENNLHWSLDVTFQEDFSKKKLDIK